MADVFKANDEQMNQVKCAVISEQTFFLNCFVQLFGSFCNVNK